MTDPRVHALALFWMTESRDSFPAEDFDALVELLASDIQTAVEDFVNEDYRDITMKHLRRTQLQKGKK